MKSIDLETRKQLREYTIIVSCMLPWFTRDFRWVTGPFVDSTDDVNADVLMKQLGGWRT
ncbi:hypothetical protein [Propionivibrio sp.]|uniref:hypothetical protein n=1 Tax=Propionivibrio sp. TaxID=2212460 RepID=UPI003BF213F0